MAHWSSDVLRKIEGHAELYASPFRAEGSTYGTPTQTWVVVVDGNVYVRVARGIESTWYQAAIAQGAGRIRVSGTFYSVTFEQAVGAPADGLDPAYDAKYAGSPALLVLNSDTAKAATVLVAPR